MIANSWSASGGDSLILIVAVEAFLAIPAGLAAGVFTLLRFCLIAWRRRRESA